MTRVSSRGFHRLAQVEHGGLCVHSSAGSGNGAMGLVCIQVRVLAQVWILAGSAIGLVCIQVRVLAGSAVWKASHALVAECT